jgi:hypothetical protein
MLTLKKALYLFGALAVAVTAVQMAVPRELMAQVRAALVRDVDHPARQSVTIRNFTSSSVFQPVYTVPAGKRLVLEHVNCTSLDDQLYAGIFQGALAHENIVYSVPVINTSGTVLVADGSTRIYFEPGESINLRIFVTEATTCTLSGHTVDVP